MLAEQHNRQRTHLKGPPRTFAGCGPPDAVLEAQLLTGNLSVAPAIPVLTDAELDEIEGVQPEAEVEQQRPGRGRRGGGAARRGGRGARGRGRGAANSDHEPPSD